MTAAPHAASAAVDAPLSLVIVSGMYPPIQTGTAFYARNLARALAQAGHRVRVVALGEVQDSDAAEPFRTDRLAAWPVPLPGFFKHFRIASLLPSNYRRLHAVLHEDRVQAVLLVNHYLDIAFPAVYATRRARVPLVCSVGTQLQSSNPRRNRILGLLDRLICGTLVFPFCARVIAWDNEILRYLAERQGRRVTRKTVIVNYGVNGDIERFLSHVHDASLRGQILGVGAVSEQRSFVPLVRAFAAIADAFPQARVKIIGHVYHDAAPRLARELGVADRVEFTGEQSHAQVMQQMQCSDVLYSSLTGEYVGLGTATIESMLMGLPVLANVPLDLLGRARLEDGVHLMRCADNDPQALAGQLTRLLSDQALRERLSAGGRSFVLTHMNWSKVASDMVDVLRDQVRAAAPGHASLATVDRRAAP